MCPIPRGVRTNGAPRILASGRNFVYKGLHGQYAYPDGDHNILSGVVKPAYAIVVRRKPHAPVY